jgi:hypothetical protein
VILTLSYTASKLDLFANNWYFDLNFYYICIFIRGVDPYPDWIRMQSILWTRFLFGIRIPDPDPGTIKLRKNLLFSKFFQLFITTRLELVYILKTYKKNCLLNLCSMTLWIRINVKCWICIRIRYEVNTDPQPHY